MGETEVVGGPEAGRGLEVPKTAGEKPRTPKAPASTKPARTPRATRTRDAVVHALLTLLDQGNLRPTAREVADEAGVSLRSVYVHFDDIDALFLAAAVQHRVRVEEARGELVVEGSFEERLHAFVQRRRLTFEVTPNVRRAAFLQEPFSPAIGEVLGVARRMLLKEIDRAFEPELAAVSPEDQAFRRSSLTVVVSANTWDDLRFRQQLSVEEAEEILRYLVRLVLQSDAPSRADDSDDSKVGG